MYTINAEFTLLLASDSGAWALPWNVVDLCSAMLVHWRKLVFLLPVGINYKELLG